MRERLYLASDVGKPRSGLESSFPSWSFDHVPDSPWWYTPESVGSYKEWRPAGEYPVAGEPKDQFISRLGDIKSWLLARQERNIVVVAHWGVIRGLFGIDAANCAIRVMEPKDFLDVVPHDC
jgi:broad specificity phosphatase PhoE